jgi:hypothetical protein
MTEDQIRRAVIGCTSSDWHMKRGKHANRDGPRHDDLPFILRSIENVERFAEMAGDRDLRPVKSPISESPAAARAWDQVKEKLRAAVPESTFDIWIAPLEAAGEREGILVLLDTTGNGGIAEWVRRRYSGLLKEAVVAVADGDYTDVEIIDETGLELDGR